MTVGKITCEGTDGLEFEIELNQEGEKCGTRKLKVHETYEPENIGKWLILCYEQIWTKKCIDAVTKDQGKQKFVRTSNFDKIKH